MPYHYKRPYRSDEERIQIVERVWNLNMQGTPLKDAAKECGITLMTFHTWRRKYSLRSKFPTYEGSKSVRRVYVCAKCREISRKPI